MYADTTHLNRKHCLTICAVKMSMQGTAFRPAPLCLGIAGKMREPICVALIGHDIIRPLGLFCTIQSYILSPTRSFRNATSTRLKSPSTLILVNLPLVTEDGAFPGKKPRCLRLTRLILGHALGRSLQRIPCLLPQHLYSRRSTSAMLSHPRVARSGALVVLSG